jgi:CRP-like cAMP-binding protein/small-conductance mechanosensitive channel
MKYPRFTDYLFPSLLFFAVLLLSQSGLFNYPSSDTKGAEMDKLFFYVINSSLWISLAFLINTALRVFVWGSLIKIKTGSIFGKTIQDFITVLIYTIAIGIIVTNVFFIEFNASMIFILLVLLFLGTIFHPKLVSLISTKYLSSEHPYNLNDWIEILSKDGKSVITGEVYDISRKGTRLKTESNSIVLIPNYLIESEYVIRNYWATNKKVEFEVEFVIDNAVTVERAKRILIAASKQAILQKGLLKIPEPQVHVKDVSHNGIVYSIKYWIIPWEDISPREAKDIIISIVLEHLSKSGINLAYKKLDVFTAEMPKRNMSIYSSKDRYRILNDIELFTSFTKEELKELSNNLEVCKVSRSDSLITQGEVGNSMFILLEGLLNVFVQTENGNNIQVGELHPGQFMGEVSLLTGEKRSASVIASTDSLVFELTKEALQPILEKRVELVDHLSKVISQRHDLNIELIKQHESNKFSKTELVIAKIKEFFGISGK